MLVAVFSGPLGDLITGNLPPSSAHVAGRALAVLVPAAFGQLLAALAASALAAVDSYGTAAAGFALGGLAGLIVFAALADGHGIVALAWGLAVNATVALAVPVVALVRKHALSGPAPARLDILPRLWHLLAGRGGPARAAGLLPARAAFRREARRRQRHELLVRVPRCLDARRRDGVLARPDLVRAAHAPRCRSRSRPVATSCTRRG